MKIIFDVLHLYYLPQYLPVKDELSKAGHESLFVFYKTSDESLNEICLSVIQKENLNCYIAKDWQAALSFYLEQQANWIIFGNAVEQLDVIHQVSKTVLMQHGIGPKSCYYEVSENPTTVRFIEGQHRLTRLENLYPTGNFVDTGYAKLDAAVNSDGKGLTLSELKLDPTKPTLLYAPTFYPSSIECFSDDFAKQFADYNIILKPHFFTLTKPKYKKQQNKLKTWAKQPNVYLANLDDYNLIPFMAISDVLISDASSAIFEFVALKKPVVWCDFYKLRWSYRGIFSFRFKQRLDSDIEYFNQVAYKAASYNDLKTEIPKALKSQNDHSDIIKQLAGEVDGKCSARIVNYLLEN